MGIEKIIAWLRHRSRPLAGSCAEFDSNPYRFTRSPWIKSLIASPMFDENKLNTPYDVLHISNPQKRTGFLFIKDLLRLERIARYGSWGLYGTMGDGIIRAVYKEEFVRLVADLREASPSENLCIGGGLDVAQVQQMANGLIASARQTLPPKPQERP